MYSLSLSDMIPVDVLAAKIQSKIGRFLQMKEYLVSQAHSFDPVVSSKAQYLLKKQIDLEKRLPDALKEIDELQKTFSLSTSKDVGKFAIDLNNHMRHVDDFKRGAPKAPSSVFTTTFAGIPKEVLEKGLFIFGLGRTIIKPSIFSFAILIAGAWLAGKKYIETG